MGLILVLDDDEDGCQLLRRVLSASGHQVEAFTHWKDAMDWLEDHEPQVAVVETRPWDMNWMNVVRRLRLRRRSTRVLLVTGHPCLEILGPAMELGVEDCLVKPVEIEDLEERVDRALRLIL